MTQWQDISTAPKDGTEILLSIDGKSRVARWSGNFANKRHGVFPWECQSGQNAWRENVPTHWMPLPPPPEEAS